MKRKRKIMGLEQSKDLDLLMFYKGKVQKNHGLSQSKDLDFNRYIKEISRKMMGTSQSKDLLMFVEKLAEKSWVVRK